MSYFKDVWSNLVFNAGNATSQFVSSLNWRYQNNQMGGNIEYKSQSAYKSVLVHVAKQLAMSTLEGELNSLLPKYQKYVRDKSLKEMRAQQMENRATLIENGQKSTEGFGAIDCEGGHRLIAKDRYGTPIPEALMLHYDLPETECHTRNVSVVTEKQDVVCVNIQPDPIQETAGIQSCSTPEPANIVLQYGGVRIALSNDFEEQVLKRVLLTLRKTVC